MASITVAIFVYGASKQIRPDRIRTEVSGKLAPWPMSDCPRHELKRSMMISTNYESSTDKVFVGRCFSFFIAVNQCRYRYFCITQTTAEKYCSPFFPSVCRTHKQNK